MPIDRRRSFASPYRKAQLSARAQTGAISAQAAKLIKRDLERYADDLARIARNLPPGATQLQFTAMRRAVKSAAAQLNLRLTKTVGRFRDLSFADTQKIWEQSGRAASKAAGLGSVVIPTAPVTMLGVYANLGSAAATWQTLLRSHVANAAEAADQLIRNAIIQQADPSKLARALRPYVAGAEEFHKAFGPLAADGINLKVLRPSSPELKNAARTMNYNSRRVANSELHNARSEAELQHFAADPLIEAVLWTLSVYRGPTGHPDECDSLAASDFYGLGPGVYPLDAVPLPPHPNDRCERVPIVRARGKADDPKPLGLTKTGEPKVSPKITRRKADKIRSHVEQNLLATTRSHSSEVMTHLASPVTTPKVTGTGALVQAQAEAKKTWVSMRSTKAVRIADDAGVKLEVRRARGVGFAARQMEIDQTAARVAQGIREVRELGFDLSRHKLSIQIVTDMTSEGAYRRSPRGGLLNFRQQTQREMDKVIASAASRGWWASGSAAQVVHHELGHALHSQWRSYITASSWRIKGAKVIARQVSKYAATTPAEFVAETFAGLVSGKVYSPEVLLLYRKVGGPIAEKWKAMFNLVKVGG